MSEAGKPTIAVHGLGYVGAVSAACFASNGFRVIGVDVNEDKVRLLESGRSPVVEEGIGEITAKVIESGALTVTTDTRRAVLDSDVSLVCVGTPSTASGGLSTTYLEHATAGIGAALGETDRRHVVVYRSTMLPGTCEGLLIPGLEHASGKTYGDGYNVAVNPEYLREGSSVRDFFDPAKTVIGVDDPATGDVIASLYDGFPGEFFQVPIKVAEMTKYVDNSFHAVKVSFANEIGAVCSSLNLDSHEVMDIFISDHKLNISPAYLRPGFAFGGSCLPKDLRALNHMARVNDVDIPLLGSVLGSNESHLQRALNVVVAHGSRDVGIFGLSFKRGTDDLRESPMVELAERLIGKGFNLKIFDSDVAMSRLIGANSAYIGQRLPHIGSLLVDDADEVARQSGVLIVASNQTEVLEALERHGADRMIIDLVRLPNAAELRDRENYRAISW
jgi:GDP-mannose 6-dehydrogenase